MDVGGLSTRRGKKGSCISPRGIVRHLSLVSRTSQKIRANTGLKESFAGENAIFVLKMAICKFAKGFVNLHRQSRLCRQAPVLVKPICKFTSRIPSLKKNFASLHCEIRLRRKNL
jgi:hypothetical protein